jgi:hypothetical protein
MNTRSRNHSCSHRGMNSCTFSYPDVTGAILDKQIAESWRLIGNRVALVYTRIDDRLEGLQSYDRASRGRLTG